MVWVRMDDSTPLERRHRRLSPAANWLLMCMLAYSNRELTDGAVDRDELDLVAPGWTPDDRAAALAELELAGGIVATAGGWRIEWLLHLQPSAAQVHEQRDVADRKREADRLRIAEKRRAAAPACDVARDVACESERESRASRPVPSRPDPIPDRERAEHASALDSEFRSTEPERVSRETTEQPTSPIGTRSTEPTTSPNLTFEPHVELDDVDDDRALLYALAEVWEPCGWMHLGVPDRVRIERMLPVLGRLSAEVGAPMCELWTGAVASFKADENTLRTKHCTLAVLCSQLEQWVRTAVAAAPSTARTTPPSERWAKLSTALREAMARKWRAAKAGDDRGRADAGIAVSQLELELMTSFSIEARDRLVAEIGAELDELEDLEKAS